MGNIYKARHRPSRMRKTAVLGDSSGLAGLGRSDRLPGPSSRDLAVLAPGFSGRQNGKIFLANLGCR